ncbi:hypothetical protein AAFX91_08245 [Bradyrhizobium sp. 31Argb]|uniref:hypothetical protein n=1 Tax=Bradyrhizobium sp. 31Argb TaxID=3141247 RepID=UPI003749E3F8
MPTFEIAWTRRTSHQWRKHADDWVVEATLTERAIVGDKPALKVVCRLAVIAEDKLDDIAERDAFWHQARARLGRLQRLDGRDIDDIEMQLAKRVPRPAPATSEPSAPATVRPSAHPIRGPCADRRCGDGDELDKMSFSR